MGDEQLGHDRPLALDRWRNVDELHTQVSGKLLQCEPEMLTDIGKDHKLGGIADRPGDMVDVFHTNFGIAGLSLLGYPGLEEVDPV